MTSPGPRPMALRRLPAAPVPLTRRGPQRGLPPGTHLLPGRVSSAHRRPGLRARDRRGHFEEAYLIARGPNPFASICGRVCGAPCEIACRRGKVPRVDDDGTFVANDRPISIRALKRFVCSLAGPESRMPTSVLDAVKGWVPEVCADADEMAALLKGAVDGRIPRASGQKVAIIGAGPAGLSAAHDLALLGFKPIVYESEPVAAGHARGRRPRLPAPARAHPEGGRRHRGPRRRDPVRRDGGQGRLVRGAAPDARRRSHRRRREALARARPPRRERPRRPRRRGSPARRLPRRATPARTRRRRRGRRQRRVRRRALGSPPDRVGHGAHRGAPPGDEPRPPRLARGARGDARRHRRDPRGRRRRDRAAERLGPGRDRARRRRRRRGRHVPAVRRASTTRTGASPPSTTTRSGRPCRATASSSPSGRRRTSRSSPRAGRTSRRCARAGRRWMP